MEFGYTSEGLGIFAIVSHSPRLSLVLLESLKLLRRCMGCSMTTVVLRQSQRTPNKYVLMAGYTTHSNDPVQVYQPNQVEPASWTEPQGASEVGDQTDPNLDPSTTLRFWTLCD